MQGKTEPAPCFIVIVYTGIDCNELMTVLWNSNNNFGTEFY